MINNPCQPKQRISKPLPRIVTIEDTIRKIKFRMGRAFKLASDRNPRLRHHKFRPGYTFDLDFGSPTTAEYSAAATLLTLY